MNKNIFVDTNIFVYAYIDNDVEKHIIAKKYLQDENNVFMISTQILSEIYATLSKYRIEHNKITAIINEISNLCEVYPVGLQTVKFALDLKNRYFFSYWDCLFLASALENSCQIVFTEDLQDGQMIDGRLKTSNPFIAKLLRKDKNGMPLQ